MSERPDKRHATQFYFRGTFGAVRLEDEMVVKATYDDDA